MSLKTKRMKVGSMIMLGTNGLIKNLKSVLPYYGSKPKWTSPFTFKSTKMERAKFRKHLMDKSKKLGNVTMYYLENPNRDDFADKITKFYPELWTDSNSKITVRMNPNSMYEEIRYDTVLYNFIPDNRVPIGTFTIFYQGVKLLTLKPANG